MACADAISIQGAFQAMRVSRKRLHQQANGACRLY